MDEKSKFITAKPSEKLHPFISYYYFNTQANKNKVDEFIYFPHFRNALTIYQNSEVKSEADSSIIKPNNQIKYSISYSTIHTSPRIVKIISPFNKIGIVYHPLGINNLVKDVSLSEIIKNGFDFKYFGEDFERCLDLVYKEDNIQKKAKLLDAFFISKIQLFENDVVKKSIAFIHSKNEKLSVQYVADSLGIHRRTLLREFNKHLCCSVKTYIDTVQFRKAFTAYQKAENKPKLTLLSHDFNYFDQSELVKHFKKLTNNNPTQLFKQINHLGNEDTFWQIKK